LLDDECLGGRRQPSTGRVARETAFTLTLSSLLVSGLQVVRTDDELAASGVAKIWKYVD